MDDKNKFKSLMKTSNKKKLVTSFIMVGFIFLILSILIGKKGFKNISRSIMARLGVYTEEIRSVEITPTNYPEPGSWHINKKAKWTGLGKAEVRFDVSSKMKVSENQYKDVIIVLDISGSMMGEKLEKAKADAEELINHLLSDANNKVALITFADDSTIVSQLTNNKEEVLNKLRAITYQGSTNYNSGLLNVDEVMKSYVKEETRDLITLFLTDGYPNIDTPNQVATYQILKEKYPYMTISGIQYEMGKDIIKEMKEISDNQYIADQSTLNNVLFEASVSPIIYENFIVEDYIDNDNFILESINDVKVSMGTVELTTENGIQKITWNLGTNFMTGRSANMTINLKLKDQLVDSNGYYATNQKETITTKLPEENKIITTSPKTPVLKTKYQVIYEANTPAGCMLSSIPSEEYSPYERVTIKQDKLTCPGYLFKGYEIRTEDEKDITKLNSDMFMMPEHDVVIRGTWSKHSITKSMVGTVHEKVTLYKVLQNEATSGGLAREYTGLHQDSMAGVGREKIYHWYATNNTEGQAIKNKNNVIFGGFCWEMIRTTDTGGVKLIYNGVPTSGTCNNTGAATQIGTSPFNSGYNSPAYVGYMYNTVYARQSKNIFNTNYLYGNSFTYDGTNYTLTDTISDAPDATHHYTCFNTTGTCSTISYIYNNNNPFILILNVYYINLMGGKSVDDALLEMLSAKDVNTKDSTIKGVIDTWYKNNLEANYSSYIEDTIYCNNRSIKNIGGWNPDGGVLNSSLQFKEYNTTKDLSCERDLDQFSVTNPKAKLTYPVGLITAPEMNLLNNNEARKTGSHYWLFSPRYFNSIAYGRYVSTAGSLSSFNVSGSNGARPSVSLISGIGYTSGDGSKDNPYIVDIN